MHKPAPNTVTVYVTTYCSFCGAAKRYLDKMKVAYTTVDATSEDDLRMWLVEETKLRTVPQIFIGTKGIGGFQEMRTLDSKGGLKPMLDAEAISYAA
ncbi:MAG: glutaredoxin 3 [Bradymonadia bacterium]|jgi:glutaredoxin 3